MLTLKWCNFMFRHFNKQICAESWTGCLVKDWWHADTLCFEIHRILFNNSQSHRLFYSSFHSDYCTSIIRCLQPALHKVLILCSKDLIWVHLSAYGPTGVTFLLLKSKTILILSNSSDNRILSSLVSLSVYGLEYESLHSDEEHPWGKTKCKTLLYVCRSNMKTCRVSGGLQLNQDISHIRRWANSQLSASFQQV